MIHRCAWSMMACACLAACGVPCPAGLVRAGSACIAPAGGGDVELGRGTVGPEGGSVRAGAFRLEIPPGAVEASVSIRLFAADPETLPSGVVPGSALRIEPAGTAFALPARLFVRFDASSTGETFDPGMDTLAYLGDPPEELESQGYDEQTREASASVAHLSPFGVWRMSLCLAPRTWCRPRGCVNTATDPLHCGGCYAQCAPGASCLGGACTPPRDAGTDGGLDASSDAGTDGGTDAAIDGGGDGGADAGTDAGADTDAGPPAPCTMGAPGIATRQELFAGAYNNPQVATEIGGAVMYWGDVFLARFDAAGARRGPVEVLPTYGPPAGIAQADSANWELFSGPGVTYVRRVAADGSVDAPITVGSGRAMEGGIAYHAASGELGVLREDGGMLVASVIDSSGTPVDSVIGPSADFLVMPSIVARDAASASHFTVVFALETATYEYTARARGLAPLDPAVDLSMPGTARRTALHVSATSTPGLAVAVWLDAGGVHAATIDATGAASSLGLVFAEPPGVSFSRASVQPSAAGFDLLVDRYEAPERDVAVRSYSVTGVPAGAAERVAPICGLAYGEGRISFVRGVSARHAGWSDLGTGNVVFATF